MNIIKLALFMLISINCLSQTTIKSYEYEYCQYTDATGKINKCTTVYELSTFIISDDLQSVVFTQGNNTIVYKVESLALGNNNEAVFYMDMAGDVLPVLHLHEKYIDFYFVTQSDFTTFYITYKRFEK